jgi:ABC-type multidrug transport system fused ATPase/permease subunit
MSILRDVWAILAPQDRRRSVLALGLLLSITVVEILSIGLLVPLLGVMTADTAGLPAAIRERLGANDDASTYRVLLLLMAGLVALHAAKALYLLGVNYLLSRYVRSVQANASRRLFTSALAQPWSFHLQRNSAGIVHMVEETRAFSQVCQDLLQIASELLVGTGLLVMLLWFEPLGATLIAVMVGLAWWLLNRIVRPRSRRWAAAGNHHAYLLRKLVQEGLAGIKEVKMYGCEREVLAEFRPHSEATVRASTLQWLVEQMPRPWFEMLSIATLFLMVAAMAWSGEPVPALVPTLGLYVAVAFRMLPSVNHATLAIQRLRRVEPMIGMLRGQLGLGGSLPGPGPAAPIAFRDAIRIEGVSFRYPGTEHDVLSGFDVAIPHGASVGFLGRSGAGKSTLVDVLLGLLSPTSGRVTVDGAEILCGLGGWQRIVGYVPQSIFLLDASIRRNVAFGVPEREIDDDAVRRAIAAARLEDLVRTLPDGLESIVGERGTRLSGGQRQRLAIARALYRDPQVLVLDEATSALDTETEREVMAAVESLHGAKTLVIVAHRLSTLAGCDVLHRIESGTIVRSGTFAEVMAGETAPPRAG